MAEDMMNEDDIVVVMTDEAGNEYYYREEMIIPVEDEKYALLVGIHDEDEEHAHTCGCGCGCDCRGPRRYPSRVAAEGYDDRRRGDPCRAHAPHVCSPI